MKFTRLVKLAALLLVTLLGCENKTQTKHELPQDDTSKVIRALFNEDFLRLNMPGYGAPGVGQKSIFGDTILFEYNESLDQYIPQSFSNHFLRRITRDSICILAKRLSGDAFDFPDFMKLIYFQKIDSGYQIMLQATCVIPEWTSKKIDTSKPCTFGMLCGGGIAVKATKMGDSINLKRLGGWSD
jgi:hypothetical protein